MDARRFGRWLAAPVTGQTLSTTSGASLTVQSGATLYVAGAVQNAAGSTLTNAGTVQLTGDLANAGMLTSTGTLLFSGAQDYSFTPGSGASITNRTLSNTGVAGRNRLFLPQDLAVSGILTLTGAAAGVQVQVYDAIGKLVLATTADATGAANLALPTGLAQGVYLVRVGSSALRLSVTD